MTDFYKVDELGKFVLKLIQKITINENGTRNCRKELESVFLKF